MTEDEKIVNEQTAEAETAEAMPQADEEINKTAESAEAETAAKDGSEDENAGAAEEAAEAETEAAAEAADAGAEETQEQSKPDKKDKQIEELNDRYKRLFAEFDNYRKRTDAEKTAMFTEGEKTVLLKVLPLIDNFERALSTIPEEQKGSALADGIEKVYRSFTDQLTALGVTAIEAVDQPFDANLHNAVMHVEDDSLPDNTVVEEFQKSYMFKDKVLRYSMVKVAN